MMQYDRDQNTGRRYTSRGSRPKCGALALSLQVELADGYRRYFSAHKRRPQRRSGLRARHPGQALPRLHQARARSVCRPEAWIQEATQHEGSWWMEWARWLALDRGILFPPASGAAT